MLYAQEPVVAGRRPAWSQVKHERERVVDGSLLLSTQTTSELTEALDVHGAQLLDEHTRAFARELDLGPERRRRGAARGRRDDRGRETKQLICLNDHAVPRTRLLSAAPRRQTHAVHLAADHSGQSAATASMSAIAARRSAVSTGSAARRLTSAASAER